MEYKKTKAIRNIEERMEGMDEGTLRHTVLENAKGFKSSWLGLGQSLSVVWKDKLYKDWGYQEFDTYTSKEIGIKKQTALKLLRSYSFLEKEEPVYLQKQHNEEIQASSMPNYEAVDVLRKASKNKNLDSGEYQRIKKYVLEDGNDGKAVAQNIATITKGKEEFAPDEEKKRKKLNLLKRFLGNLKSVTAEMKQEKIVTKDTLGKMNVLIKEVEKDISGQE